MKLKRDTRTLKQHGLASLRRGLEIFNGYDDRGRTESVLLHLQHSSEMLVKALLVQRSQPVFDKEKGTSIGLERALNVATSNGYITGVQAGAIRAIDAMRDAAQHWMLVVPEDVLYLNSRTLITAIDELLQEHFEDTLANHLPLRVLPISTKPLQDFELLIDREYTQITELLAPGKRARDEARGRIRALLAMEGHVTDTIAVSERDIDRIERAIRNATPVAAVFPRLMTLASDVAGEGPTMKVRFTKKQGAPVRFVSGDDPEAAAAIREVDLQKKYHLSPQQLAEKLKLTAPKCKALRDYVNVDSDPANMMVFEFGSQRHPRYSDNALRALQEANTAENIESAWRNRKR
ncbi:hypothetical protein QHI69_05735 [Burkholderia gladioli pv. gladioli]|uniref:hypothetical protein n=1 Tax=Burkholderia gladioli TaxID=28095 RepID=UPI0016418F02|nr:hypothetical protein [Burkholderia gladioli]MDJ1161405.1 hypothetical protein [Burkholderia gladioli pv. gladioli]